MANDKKKHVKKNRKTIALARAHRGKVPARSDVLTKEDKINNSETKAEQTETEQDILY